MNLKNEVYLKLKKKLSQNRYWQICAFVDECTMSACPHHRPHLDNIGTHKQINMGYNFCKNILKHKAGCRRLSKVERVLRVI